MPHQEAKLDEKQVALFIEKLRLRTGRDKTLGNAVLDVLSASINQDLKESSDEIAKTLCEILEPERLGNLVWWTCKSCKQRLSEQEIKDRIDTCFPCRSGMTTKDDCL